MKYFSIPLLAFLLSGCVKKADIEFTGNAPGVKSGVFIVKTVSDSTVYGENIKDGKFSISKRPLKYPGYYMINVTDDVNNDNHSGFEVYLEGGQYTIETEEGKLYKYPKITSPSKVQEQLSAYYAIVDKVSAGTAQEVKAVNQEIKDKEKSSSPQEYTRLLNKLTDAQNKMLTNNVVAFKEFVAAYPNSDISAHLMSKLNYDDDPATYYTIYKTLTPVARNSEEGKELGDRLSHLVKLVVGAKAPDIVGSTPEGKPFDKKSVNGKLIVIDFWRAGNDVSRQNHQLLKDLLTRTKSGNLAIVGVSLDIRKDWWAYTIKQDDLNWAQITDAKGDDSPNAANWNITQIPTYYLLDSNWNIVERNIDIGRIEFEMNDYLKKGRKSPKSQ
jgi:hypothetical protein